MKTGKIGISQAGVKNHGRTILDAVRDSGNLELVSVYDTDLGAARAAAVEFGATAASDYRDLLFNPRTEAVAIVTPNHLHFEGAMEAFSAGKHVFVEKPMALSVSQAAEMTERAEQLGSVLMVGHNTRRRGVFRRAKQLLREKRIGKPVAAEMNISRPAGLEADLPEWKTDPGKCPLLPMTQLGIHFADTIEYLLGNIRHVSCVAASRAMRPGTVDTASAILELAGGIPATLTSSYVTPEVYFINIYGTGGIMRCGSLSLELELFGSGHGPQIIRESFEGEGARSFVLEMQEFGECILAGKRPETGGPEGVRAVAVIEAMRRSIERKSAVDIGEML